MDVVEVLENREAMASPPRKASTTQVLIVLSDNGVEEIPFATADEKSKKQVEAKSVS